MKEITTSKLRKYSQVVSMNILRKINGDKNLEHLRAKKKRQKPLFYK